MRLSLIFLPLAAVVVAAATILVSGSDPAETAFPGFNGRIAFQSAATETPKYTP